MKRLILALLALLLCTASFSQGKKATYKVAQRDTCDLFMDVYEPVAVPADTLDRPTILFVFGGGFIMGRRDDPWVMPWFKLLNENGYRVVSVDYRLGLKGVRMRFDLFHLIQSADYTKKAVDIIAGRVETEASGGITFDTIRDYAEQGVDFISVGALTHSVKGLDMSFKACE